MSQPGISIADLPVTDDLNVPMDPDTYVDQQGPAPIAPGTYRFVPLKAKARTTKEGGLMLVDGKYPIVTLEQAKVVEPVENERQVGLFKDIRFKPFVRKGPRGDAVASDLYDILRAFDDSVRIEDGEHAKRLLDQYIQQGTPFLAQVGWSGYDKDYVETEFAKIGGKAAASKEVANEIYSKARLRTKNFVQNGQLVTSAIGPSGNPVDARLEVTRFYPSSTELGKGKDERGRDRVELGPFKKATK